MIIQLLEALVETIRGKKEGFRVRDVHRHRDTQGPTRFPHRIKTLIVHLHKWSGRDLLPQIQSQCLEDFQSTCSRLVCANDFVSLKLAVSRLIRALPPGLGKD